MKKTIILILCAIAGMSVNAQKLGHIHSDTLLQIMPEYAAAQLNLEERSKQYQAEITSQEQQLQEKYTAYQSLDPNTPAAIIQSREAELNQMQQGLQEFALFVQNELEKEQNKLMKPIYDKAKAAIEKVSKDNGYTYIFDASTGILLFENGDDIMGLVKTELGL